MRATGIKSVTTGIMGKAEKLSRKELDTLCETILAATGKAGYITEAHVINSSSIKIGMHMSSFRVDTAKLGHNAQVGRAAYGWNGASSPKGYKRTNVPTWDQRVEFNYIVNSVFDRYSLDATIKSGCYTVRDKQKGAHCEYDWRFQSNGDSWSGNASDEIMTESEARDRLGSDAREEAHRIAQNAARRASKCKLSLVVAS